MQVGGLFLGRGDDDGGLEAECNNAQAKGKVENGGKNISQLVGTCSEGPLRDVIWFICLAGAGLPQGPVYHTWSNDLVCICRLSV